MTKSTNPDGSEGPELRAVDGAVVMFMQGEEVIRFTPKEAIALGADLLDEAYRAAGPEFFAATLVAWWSKNK